MGWFDDLIKERKQKGQDIYESSLKDIRSSVFGRRKKERRPEVTAMQQILRYYHISLVEMPDAIQDIGKDLDLVLSKHNLRTQKVSLQEELNKPISEPIIVFSKETHVPVVLYTKKDGRKYASHPVTGEKAFLTPEILEKLEDEAIAFYSPLPRRKMKVRDYLSYFRQGVRIRDLLLILLLVILVSAGGLASPYLTKILVGDVVDNQDYLLFLGIGFALLGASVALLLIKAVQAIVNARVTIKADYEIHSAMMMHTLSLPTSFFRQYSTGELNTRINSVSNLSNLLINGVFIGSLTALLSMLYLFQIGTFSLALVLPSLGVVLVSLTVSIILTFAERNLISKQTKLKAKESGISYSLISGIQKIRLTGSEKRAFAKWVSAYTKVARMQYNPPLLIKIGPAIAAAIAVGGNILIYYLVGINSIDKSTYYAFAASYGSLMTAVAAFTKTLGNCTQIGPLIEMINPILEAKPENSEKKQEIKELSGDIRLDHISFRYNENGPLILDDLSIDIHKGEYVAIVGKTGCGKSTIVRLLLGFEKPVEGHIFYDGNDLESIDLPSLRRKIGSVTQDGALFHADILHNITISAPELAEKEAWEAARIANIDEDIKSMPMRMHTIISEGQGSISGGQKQRLMIARAIVHKPKVLIFDEATSALDNQCQKTITESIGKFDCTRIVIAHRLSTIKDCDRILYLENGKIIEEGTYDELVALNGRFKKLIERQKLDS